MNRLFRYPLILICSVCLLVLPAVTAAYSAPPPAVDAVSVARSEIWKSITAGQDGSATIAITDKPDAPAGKVANHVLVAKSDMVSVVDSLVAPMSVVNALIVSLAQEQQTQMTKTFEDLENLWDEYDVYERVE